MSIAGCSEAMPRRPRPGRTTSTLVSSSTGAKHRKGEKARPLGQKEGQAGGGRWLVSAHLEHTIRIQ